MNRSEIFTTLLEKRPWTDYEWEKRTNITRATFGNNRKNNGQNVKSRTLELMAKATGFKLIQTNAKKGILPSSADALFELIENKIPTYVATPFPPLNFSQIGNTCPKNAHNDATYISSG